MNTLLLIVAGIAVLCAKPIRKALGIGGMNDRARSAIDELMRHDDTFRYRILSRLKMDCDYYLGNGGRNAKNLWMSGDPEGHIEVMYALWDSFVEKPEWLTREEIDNYARLMLEDDEKFFIESSDGNYAIQFSKGLGKSIVTEYLVNSPSGNVFAEFIWRSDNLKSAITFAKHYWDENGIIYNPSDFDKVEFGIDGVQTLDYDDYVVSTKDGKHAVEFQWMSDGDISVSAWYKGDGSNPQFDWDFWNHVGFYKTLAGAKRGAKKFMADRGYELKDTDLNKVK